MLKTGNTEPINTGRLVAGVLLGVALPFVVMAQANPDITCPGQSLDNYVQTSGDNDITFTGVCDEFVGIFRSGVTLRGFDPDPANNVIDRGLNVLGAQRVRVENLTIDGLGTGGGFGVLNGSYVDAVGVTVQNARNGFVITRGSFASLDNNTVIGLTPNNDNFTAGVRVFENSAVSMVRTTITADSSRPPVLGALALFRDSSATLRGGNVIMNNGSEAAVAILFNSHLRQDDPSATDPSLPNFGIDQFVGSPRALQVTGNSYADLRSVEMTGETFVDLHSVLDIGGDNPFGRNAAAILVNGDIGVAQDSAVVVREAVSTINGTIDCADVESSFDGEAAAVSGTINCTDFDNKKAKKAKK